MNSTKKTTQDRTYVLYVSLVVLLTTAINSTIARNEDTLLREIPYKTEDILSNNSIYYFLEDKTNDSNWWEPDTVMLYGTTSNGRIVFRYYENGLRERVTTEKLVSNEWIIENEFQYSWDDNRNLLSRVYANKNSEGVLMNQHRYLYTYNAQNLKSTELLQYWEDGQWTGAGPAGVSTYKNIYTYNENNDTLSILHHIWSINDWVKNLFYYYVYDYEANTAITTCKICLGDSLNWRNSTRFLYTFDERGNLLTKLNQFWDNNLNDWYNEPFQMGIDYSMHHEYSYNNNDKLVTHKRRYLVDDDWVNYNLRENSYDPFDNLLTQKDFSGTSNNDWSLHHLKEWTYDENNNMLTYRSTRYIGDRVFPEISTISEYDIHNNCISTLEQKWEDDQWVNDYQYTDFYNEDRNCVSGDVHKWVSGQWEDVQNYMGFQYNNRQSLYGSFYTHRFEVSYTKVFHPAFIVQQQDVDILIYPNPSQNQLYISSKDREIKKIELYNINGQKLGDYYQQEITISHLPAGIYFIKLYTDRGVVSRKVVRQ